MSYKYSHKVQGPDAPLNELDSNGCTPLMYAAVADSILAIEILLSYSAKREQVKIAYFKFSIASPFH